MKFINKYALGFVFAVIISIGSVASFASSDLKFLGKTNVGENVVLDVGSYKSQDSKTGSVSYDYFTGNSVGSVDLNCIEGTYRLRPLDWSEVKQGTIIHNLLDIGCSHYVMRATKDILEVGSTPVAKTSHKCGKDFSKHSGSEIRLGAEGIEGLYGASYLRQIVLYPKCAEAYVELASYFRNAGSGLRIDLSGNVETYKPEPDKHFEQLNISRKLLLKAIQQESAYTDAWLKLMESYEPVYGKGGGSPTNYLSIFDRSEHGNGKNTKLLSDTGLALCSASNAANFDKNWVEFKELAPVLATRGQKRIEQALRIAPKQVYVLNNAAYCYESLSGISIFNSRLDTQEKRTFARMAIVNYEKAITLVDKPWFVAHFKQRVANLHYHLGDAKRAIQLFEETIPFAIQAPQLEWFDNNPYGFQVYISSISILDAQIVNAYIQISDRTGAVRLYDKLSLMNREGEITTKYEGLDNLRRKINDAWPGAI